MATNDDGKVQCHECYQTPEAQAFQAHYGRLLQVIQESELPGLAAYLMSDSVISPHLNMSVVNESRKVSVRISELLLAVMAHLEENPSKFNIILDIFQQQLPATLCVSKDISDTLNLIKESKIPPVCVKLHSAISRYSAYLKKLYIRTKYPIKRKWPPSSCKKVIKLAAVEKCGKHTLTPKPKFLDEIIHDTEVTPIELSDLTKTSDGSQPKCIVVQGAPGIGKSTFAWKACRKWGKGKLFQEYSLVVLLRMRESYVRDAKSLCDLFHSSDKKLSQDVAQEVIDKSGEGILFILEGIDELPSSVLDDENSVLMELLQGSLLPDVTIVVTSRPWAVQFLIEKCGEQISRHVEILGFTADDIMQYISHSFPKEEQEDFKQYIISQPHLLNIMYVPLNTAIAVQIYQQRKRSDQPLPKTMTQLYTSLVQSLILRYLKNIPEYRNIKLGDLCSLPEPILHKFHELCELAYSGFTKGSTQVIFNKSDLSSEVDSLGLMQSTSEFQADSGSSVSHAFLHITIQEFLAAYYVSIQGEEFAAAFVCEHLKSPLFSVLFRFLAGLSCIGISLWKIILPSLYCDNNCIRIHSPKYLHWLYEAQSPELCKTVLNTERVDFAPLQFSLSDINSLSYCLHYSTSIWTLAMKLRLSLPTRLFQTASSTQHSPSATEAAARIQKLEIYSFEGNCSGNTVSTFLQSIPTHCFLGMQEISITVGRSSLTKLAEMFEFHLSSDDYSIQNTSLFKSLTVLQLNNVLLGDGGAVSMLKSFQSSESSISSISLIHTYIGCSDVIELCKIISNSSTFHYLNIADNSLSSDSLRHLFSALMSPSISLQTLNVSENAISSPDMEFLSIALEVNQSLTSLNLSRCSIDAEGISHLASGLTKNSNLIYLRMVCNHIGVDGAGSLADLLHVNTTLQYLALHHDPSIHIMGAELLLSSLNTNRTLKRLTLDKVCEPAQLLVGELFVDSKRNYYIEFV